MVSCRSPLSETLPVQKKHDASAWLGFLVSWVACLLPVQNPHALMAESWRMGRAALVGGMPCGRSMACLAMAGMYQGKPHDQTAQPSLVSRPATKNFKPELIISPSTAIIAVCVSSYA